MSWIPYDPRVPDFGNRGCGTKGNMTVLKVFSYTWLTTLPSIHVTRSSEAVLVKYNYNYFFRAPISIAKAVAKARSCRGRRQRHCHRHQNRARPHTWLLPKSPNFNKSKQTPRLACSRRVNSNTFTVWPIFAAMPVGETGRPTSLAQLAAGLDPSTVPTAAKSRAAAPRDRMLDQSTSVAPKGGPQSWRGPGETWRKRGASGQTTFGRKMLPWRSLSRDPSKARLQSRITRNASRRQR